MKSNLITNSRVTSFLTCPRLHRFQYIDGLRPVATPETLSFGTLMHKALEVFWNWHKSEATNMAATAVVMEALQGEEDPFVRARARVLMSAYIARWSGAMEEYDILSVEKEFRFDDDSDLAGIEFGGKLDAVVRKRVDGTLWVLDHKTTGADLSPGSTYWTRLRMDSQISLYLDGAEKLYKEPVAGFIYDVIEKPDIRPLKATPEDKRKYTKAGALYANQREADETPEEFENRLIQLVAEDPNRFLQRAEVIRLDSEMDAARADVRDAANLIRVAERNGYHPRNVGACKQYGRDCSYLSLCSGLASADDEHLYQVGKLHPELNG